MGIPIDQFKKMRECTESARKRGVENRLSASASVKQIAAGEPKAFVAGGAFGRCDHKFVDSNRCLKCGWSPLTCVEYDILNKLSDKRKETGSVRLVLDFWVSEGVPRPHVEFFFHPVRKWRFDFCWGAYDEPKVYLEVQGAIHGTGKKCPTCGQRKAGRHTRGPALLNEHDKINSATELGWRPLFCTPSELFTVALTKRIKRALGI